MVESQDELDKLIQIWRSQMPEIGWLSVIDAIEEAASRKNTPHRWWWEHTAIDTAGSFPWPRGSMVRGVTWQGESSEKYSAMLPAWGT